jgi:hypothetical protein
MSADENNNKNFAVKTIPWIQLVVLLITVTTTIGGGMSLLDPRKNNPDISVWIKEEIPIQLPETDQSVPLTISYDNSSVSKATILNMNVSNTGRVPIGENGKYITIILMADANARLALIAPPESEPKLDYKVVPDVLLNQLLLQIALFNPKDSISLQMIVIDPTDVDHPNIRAEIDPYNRIPNLAQPIVARDEPITSRLTDAFFYPIWIIVIALFLIVWFTPSLRPLIHLYPRDENMNKTAFNLLVVITLFFISSLIASGLTFAIVKFYMSIL